MATPEQYDAASRMYDQPQTYTLDWIGVVGAIALRLEALERRLAAMEVLADEGKPKRGRPRKSPQGGDDARS